MFLLFLHCVIIKTNLIITCQLTQTPLFANFQQKLPHRLIPDGMQAEGAITLVCDPNTRLSSTYTISADEHDGRVCINRWDKFMKMEKDLKEGHKLLMILYIGDHGIYLFVSHVPDVALDK